MSNTPDLDAFFGPKEETTMPELRPYKYEWRCEDRIKRTLDAFYDAAHLQPPKTTRLRSWVYAGARTLVDELGEKEAPEFVRWAVLKFGNLTLSSPGSLLNLIPAWQKREDDSGFGIEVTV